LWSIGDNLVLVVYFSPGQERDLTLVTSTGDWQQIPNDVVYWRVDGGLCVAAEKNLVLIVECVGKAGLKPRPFCFALA
jgi:hypothetical protein